MVHWNFSLYSNRSLDAKVCDPLVKSHVHASEHNLLSMQSSFNTQQCIKWIHLYSRHFSVSMCLVAKCCPLVSNIKHCTDFNYTEQVGVSDQIYKSCLVGEVIYSIWSKSTQGLNHLMRTRKMKERHILVCIVHVTFVMPCVCVCVLGCLCGSVVHACKWLAAQSWSCVCWGRCIT